MRSWGDLNPNAIRVIRRILVLVDSIRPLDRLCSIAATVFVKVVEASGSYAAGSAGSRGGLIQAASGS